MNRSASPKDHSILIIARGVEPQTNISAGTQVVALVAVRGTNNSLVHPRGAVGVVTRTPAGAEKHFLVRFPDGFEATFTIDQLDVLKHFKDRLGATNQDGASAVLIGAGVLVVVFAGLAQLRLG